MAEYVTHPATTMTIAGSLINLIMALSIVREDQVTETYDYETYPTLSTVYTPIYSLHTLSVLSVSCTQNLCTSNSVRSEETCLHAITSHVTHVHSTRLVP